MSDEGFQPSTKYIEVKVPGAVLFLLPSEYAAALKRGKAIMRWRKQREREMRKAANTLNNNQS